MHAGNIRKIQQDQYAINRAFQKYQDAVEAWARAGVELDKAHDAMQSAGEELRKLSGTYADPDPNPKPE